MFQNATATQRTEKEFDLAFSAHLGTETNFLKIFTKKGRKSDPGTLVNQICQLYRESRAGLDWTTDYAPVSLINIGRAPINPQFNFVGGPQKMPLHHPATRVTGARQLYVACRKTKEENGWIHRKNDKNVVH